MDRKEAKLTGSKVYQGKPCKKCKSIEKYTSSGGCKSCADIRGLTRLNDPVLMAQYRTPEKRRKKQNEWRKNNPEKRKAQKQRQIEKNGTWYSKNKLLYKYRSIEKNYGISKEEYLEMLSKQNNKCLICDTHESKFKRGLAVDHDHITGKIRGLLCHYCNGGLGHFKDNIENMIKAIEYLKVNS